MRSMGTPSSSESGMAWKRMRLMRHCSPSSRRTSLRASAMVSFTPQGVGVVEAAVLVAFTLFGIDQATGMAVVMVYRGIVFWLPFLIGAIMIQRTRAFGGHKEKR